MAFLWLRDRRVWLLAALSALAWVVGRWSIGPDLALTLVAQWGYWVVLTVFVLFVRSLWRLWREEKEQPWRPVKADFVAVGLVLACSGIWATHEKHGFKVLADEVLLVGTSMGMHYEREVAYPVRATDVHGPFQLTQRVLDKRPFFFPFLVSLIHDVTGYRPENAFYLNTGLGVVLLSLLYLAGWRIAGARWAGGLLVLLFAGLPLAAQQAAGGGFEQLNLVMILSVLLLARRYADRPDGAAAEALVLAAVLLALTRYESVIFVPLVALIVGQGWMRAGKVVLTWPAMLAPVFLLPYLLQNRVFTANPSAWELASRPGSGAPFSLDYLPDNLGHALAFFFDTSGYQANSVFFAALGLAALPLGALMLVRIFRGLGSVPATEVATAIVMLGLWSIGGMLMIYFWGQFDHPVIRRLSLPVHLLFALSVAVVGARFCRQAIGWQLACAGALLALVFQGLPMMAKQAYAWDYPPGVETAWRREFIEAHPEKDYLFIDRDSIFWITQRVVATPSQQARERREGLAFHLRNHSFSAMYVFQRFVIDEATGTLRIEAADDIGPEFALETVWEKRIATLKLARISRIKSIEQNGQVVAQAGLVELAEGEKRTAPELEAAKAKYLEQWIKHLP